MFHISRMLRRDALRNRFGRVIACSRDQTRSTRTNTEVHLDNGGPGLAGLWAAARLRQVCAAAQTRATGLAAARLRMAECAGNHAPAVPRNDKVRGCRIALSSEAEMTDWSRREVLSIVAAGLAASELPGVALSEVNKAEVNKAEVGKAPAPVAAVPQIRTITAGVELSSLTDQAAIDRALGRLQNAAALARKAGYTVQTLRLATNVVIASLDAGQRKNALPALEKLDARAASHGALVSIGPILTTDQFEPELADWAVELVKRTHTISFSVSVTPPPIPGTPKTAERAPAASGINRAAVRSAANIISKLSQVEPSGAGNFRFAAAAAVKAGTPFFPVAYHEGADTLALGIESAGIVKSTFTNLKSFEDGEQHLRGALVEQLGPIERIGIQAAAAENIQYLGIDPSPAPSIANSIGAAIETLTGQPFGHASTLQACAAITGAIKTLSLRTCGYAGLMLPVLEDPVLAKRASEHRYGIAELLLYSTVCGTGLDVVPIPGDTSVEAIGKLIGDVATLAVRLRKPLSARLFPIPGKKAGEVAHFKDPRLTECQIFAVG
jgi:uncharacterized protein (UPF0210 family)